MDLVIKHADITTVEADLIVLKHANGFHGADYAVARAINFNEDLMVGDVRSLAGSGIAASKVIFIGVGPLHEFRYEQIQEFGATAIKHAVSPRSPVEHLALTIHGPGYGLDTEQAFLSLVAGVLDECRNAKGCLQRVTIAERSDKRYNQLLSAMAARASEFGLRPGDEPNSYTLLTERTGSPAAQKTAEIIDFGERAEHRARLFIAMPLQRNLSTNTRSGFVKLGEPMASSVNASTLRPSRAT